MVLNGVLGLRGDGYAPDSHMTGDEAEAYHARQVSVFAAAGADMVSAITMTYLEEGLGQSPSGAAGGRNCDGRPDTSEAVAIDLFR